MSEVFEVRERPQLRRPLLLAGISGWGNAGMASTSAIEYLLGEPRPDPVAAADTEQVLDFTVSRPISKRGGPDGWQLIFPTLACYALRRPEADRDLLLILGPEPNFHSLTLARSFAAFAADCHVELALTLGAFVGPVSHRRADVVRRTLHPPLDLALAQLGAVDTEYEGPTSFQSVLLDAFHNLGIPAASLWVAAPPYIQGASPRAALALLEVVERLAETNLNLGRLRARSADWVQQLDLVLESNPALRNQLSHIVNLEPAEPTPPPPPAEDRGDYELPSGQALVEDLERYLRKLRGQSKGEEEE